jgi:chromosome segregation ATPase
MSNDTDLDRQSLEMMRELSIQDLTIPKLRDRTTIDDTRKARYRLQEKLKTAGLVETDGEKIPETGGRATEIWSLTETGRKRAKNAEIEEERTLEDVVEKVDNLEARIDTIRNVVDQQKSRIDSRATHSKVDRSIEQIEDDVSDLQTGIEMMEGRAKEAGKRKARAKVAELKEEVIDERLQSWKEDNIRDLIDDVQRIRRENSDLRNTNDRLRENVSSLQGRVDELESKIEGNSDNSSSDGLISRLLG